MARAEAHRRTEDPFVSGSQRVSLVVGVLAVVFLWLPSSLDPESMRCRWSLLPLETALRSCNSGKTQPDIDLSRE